MIPIMGFAAPSGTGKTTLMEAVIAELTARGVRVAALKHGHHPVDPDVPGKDTHRFRQAGAATVLFACPQRWFMVRELADQEEPTVTELAVHLQGHDLILVEGYKNDAHPKIALHRRAAGNLDWLCAMHNVVAVATDDPGLAVGDGRQRLDIGQPAVVAEFIVTWLGLEQAP
ncbi:MAG: molybdopterin-guanine dinucleotide biosynthesis protein B [Magnetococcales bacterium]|nr:molybdopterin-guanine dinucleotide biosynthesis protein B [Magnetococcales bacterium]